MSSSSESVDVDPGIVVFQCSMCFRALGDSSTAKILHRQGDDAGLPTAVADNLNGKTVVAGQDQATRQPLTTLDALANLDAFIDLSMVINDNVVVMAEKIMSHTGTDKGSVYHNLKCKCGQEIGQAYLNVDIARGNDRFCLHKNRLIGYQIGTSRLVTKLQDESSSSVVDAIQKMQQMIVMFHQRLDAFEDRVVDRVSSTVEDGRTRSMQTAQKISVIKKRKQDDQDYNVSERKIRDTSRRSPRKRQCYENLKTSSEYTSDSP